MQQTALITGASRGLGLALAGSLAQRGWHLVVDARDPEALEHAARELRAHTRVDAVSGDVADERHRHALRDAVEAAGGLDVLVHNASSLGPSPQPALDEYPIEVLEDVYAVNVFAPLRLTQLVLPHLRPGARVISVTSDAAVEAYAGWGGYGASKAALEHASAVLAQERPDLRVLVVDPGDMRTEMHQNAFPGEDISDRPDPDERVPAFLALLDGDFPSGRYEARSVATAASTQP